MITIGGLSAHLFVNRQVRVRKNGNAHHLMPSILKAVGAKKLTIRPNGHKHDEIVDPDNIHPWWAKNPDLKKLLMKETTAAVQAIEIHTPEGVTPTFQITSNNEVTDTPPAYTAPETTHKAEPPPHATWHPTTEEDAVILTLSSAVDPVWLTLYANYIRAEKDATEAAQMHVMMLAEVQDLRQQLTALGVTITTTHNAKLPTPRSTANSKKTESVVKSYQRALDTWVAGANLHQTYACPEVTKLAGLPRRGFEVLASKLNKAAAKCGRRVSVRVTNRGKQRLACFVFELN
jgi:hypothetical protein